MAAQRTALSSLAALPVELQLMVIKQYFKFDRSQFTLQEMWFMMAMERTSPLLGDAMCDVLRTSSAMSGHKECLQLCLSLMGQGNQLNFDRLLKLSMRLRRRILTGIITFRKIRWHKELIVIAALMAKSQIFREDIIDIIQETHDDATAEPESVIRAGYTWSMLKSLGVLGRNAVIDRVQISAVSSLLAPMTRFSLTVH